MSSNEPFWQPASGQAAGVGHNQQPKNGSFQDDADAVKRQGTIVSSFKRLGPSPSPKDPLASLTPSKSFMTVSGSATKPRRSSFSCSASTASSTRTLVRPAWPTRRSPPTARSPSAVPRMRLKPRGTAGSKSRWVKASSRRRGAKNLYHGIIPSEWVAELRRRRLQGIAVEVDPGIVQAADEIGTKDGVHPVHLSDEMGCRWCTPWSPGCTRRHVGVHRMHTYSLDSTNKRGEPPH